MQIFQFCGSHLDLAPQKYLATDSDLQCMQDCMLPGLSAILLISDTSTEPHSPDVLESLR